MSYRQGVEGIRRLVSDAAASVPIESRWQMSEQDIWHVINYLRSLGAPKK